MKSGIPAVEKPQLAPNDWGFKFGPAELFSPKFQRVPMPDFGALEYAYQSLQLPMVSPVGPGVGLAQQGVRITQPEQAYQVQSLSALTMWLSAGAMYNQPLTDDNGQVIPAVANEGIPQSVFRNQPATHHIDREMWANNPYPDRRI